MNACLRKDCRSAEFSICYNQITFCAQSLFLFTLYKQTPLAYGYCWSPAFPSLNLPSLLFSADGKTPCCCCPCVRDEVLHHTDNLAGWARATAEGGGGRGELLVKYRSALVKFVWLIQCLVTHWRWIYSILSLVPRTVVSLWCRQG